MCGNSFQPEYQECDKHLCFSSTTSRPFSWVWGLLFQGWLLYQHGIRGCSYVIQKILHEKFYSHSRRTSLLRRAGMHDLIWCQWVLGHLTGGEMYAPSKHWCPSWQKVCILTSLQTILLPFSYRCVNGLSSRGGLIVVKENVADRGAVFDEQDSSVTRWDRAFLLTFTLLLLGEEVRWWDYLVAFLFCLCSSF